MKLIIASNNKGKIKEIKAIFGDYFEEILSLREAGIEADPKEDGESFFDNALIKARAVHALSKGQAVISDDSGIVVPALNGAPGIFSARYAGENATDNLNNLKLLGDMTSLLGEERNAHFFSCCVMVLADGTVLSGEGAVFGSVLFAAEGSNGFGYDPLFYSFELKKSFGLATDEEKNSLSHRFRALTELYKEFAQLRT